MYSTFTYVLAFSSRLASVLFCINTTAISLQSSYISHIYTPGFVYIVQYATEIGSIN